MIPGLPIPTGSEIKLALGLAVGLMLMAIGAGGAWEIQSNRYEAKLAGMERDHAQALVLASQAKQIADERARGAEQKAQHDLAALAAQYEEDRHHAKLDADRHIADLAAGNERLRVALDLATTPGGGLVPDPAAGAGRGDGQATAALAPATASRLARRYADYNELVDQLSLCQGTLEADRAMTAMPPVSSP